MYNCTLHYLKKAYLQAKNLIELQTKLRIILYKSIETIKDFKK